VEVVSAAAPASRSAEEGGRGVSGFPKRLSSAFAIAARAA
jgi:hypothetical protein